MTTPKHVVSALFVLGAAWVVTPGAAHAQHLWVAWKAGHEAGCRSQVEDFWACLLGATQFDDMDAAWPGGERLSLAGTMEIGDCSTADPDTPSFQCIVDMTHWEVGNNDVILWVHGGTSCGGSNHGAREQDVT